MRHIPEEELHAYLDQALSRAQAVEIESHLASCARCQAERDAIAGLRDRTTALLATLAPAGSVARPSWAELRRRHQLALVRRANLLRGAVWAASLVGAIALGYRAHSWQDAAEAAAPATPGPVLSDAAPSVSIPVQQVAVETPRPATRRAPSRSVQGIEVDTLDSSPRGPAGGLWRTESLDRAVASGLNIPRVAGLPVLQIQIQDASSPMAMVAVDQQLSSGELVRTIEGPASELALMDGSAVASTGPEGAGAISVSQRHGNRMLLMTARIPLDSLRALLARVKIR